MDSFAILDGSNIVTAITESTNVDMAATGLTYVNLTTGSFTGVNVGDTWTGSSFTPPSNPTLLSPSDPIVNSIPIPASAFIGDVPAFEAVNPGPLGNSYPAVNPDGSSDFNTIVAAYNVANPLTPIQLTQWFNGDDIPSSDTLPFSGGGFVSNVLGLGIINESTQSSSLTFSDNEKNTSSVFSSSSGSGLYKKNIDEYTNVASITDNGFVVNSSINGTVPTAVGISSTIEEVGGGSVAECRNFVVGPSSATTKYGFYNQYLDSNNYFAKNVLVGGNLTPYNTEQLSVRGKAYVYQVIEDSLNEPPGILVKTVVNNTANVDGQYVNSINGRLHVEDSFNHSNSFYLGSVGEVLYRCDDGSTATCAGLQGNVDYNANGTLNDAIGATASVVNSSGTGSITNAIAYISEVANDGGGGVTNGFNFRVQANAASNAWGFYCDQDIKHFLGGETRFGGTNDAVPSASISTSGTVTAPKGVLKKMEMPDQQNDSGASTVDISNNVNYLFYDATSLVATSTVNLPCDGLGVTSDGSEVTIVFGGTISVGAPVVTALTIACLNGTSSIYGVAPTTANGGDVLKYVYRAGNDTWYRVQ